MVEVQADGQAGLDYSGLDELHKIGVVRVGAGALGDLQDQRSAQLSSGLGDALDNLHVVHVERANGVPTVVGLAEHFLGCYDAHKNYLLYLR